MEFRRIFKNLAPGLQVRAACGCHPGKKRRNNEDNFYFNGMHMASENQGLSEAANTAFPLTGDGFFCVYDGMGGGDFGEVAAYTAARTTKHFLDIKTNINPCDITPSLQRMCEAANRAVFDAAMRMGTTKMGSTLVGLYFHAGQAWACNLGDSRCYLLRNGQLQQLSEDHTDEAFMKANGITGRKPYLTQYLGIDPQEMEIVPYIKSLYLDRGDRFLICSDGVTDMVEELEISRLLAQDASPEACVSAIVKRALDAGGRDNITAIVLEIV